MLISIYVYIIKHIMYKYTYKKKNGPIDNETNDHTYFNDWTI